MPILCYLCPGEGALFPPSCPTEKTSAAFGGTCNSRSSPWSPFPFPHSNKAKFLFKSTAHKNPQKHQISNRLFFFHACIINCKKFTFWFWVLYSSVSNLNLLFQTLSDTAPNTSVSSYFHNWIIIHFFYITVLTLDTNSVVDYSFNFHALHQSVLNKSVCVSKLTSGTLLWVELIPQHNSVLEFQTRSLCTYVFALCFRKITQFSRVGGQEWLFKTAVMMIKKKQHSRL